MRDERYFELVMPFVWFGVAAGVIGALSLITVMGKLRKKWPWITRWDHWPNECDLANAKSSDGVPTTPT